MRAKIAFCINAIRGEEGYLDHCTVLEVIKYAGKSDNNNARTKAADLRASRTKARQTQNKKHESG